jgi:hypothetical protein
MSIGLVSAYGDLLINDVSGGSPYTADTFNLYCTGGQPIIYICSPSNSGYGQYVCWDNQPNNSTLYLPTGDYSIFCYNPSNSWMNTWFNNKSNSLL